MLAVRLRNQRLVRLPDARTRVSLPHRVAADRSPFAEWCSFRSRKDPEAPQIRHHPSPLSKEKDSRPPPVDRRLAFQETTYERCGALESAVLRLGRPLPCKE